MVDAIRRLGRASLDTVEQVHRLDRVAAKTISTNGEKLLAVVNSVTHGVPSARLSSLRIDSPTVKTYRSAAR